LFTLRVYAQALREEETDLSFLDSSGTRRRPHVGKEICPAILLKFLAWTDQIGPFRSIAGDAEGDQKSAALPSPSGKKLFDLGWVGCRMTSMEWLAVRVGGIAAQNENSDPPC